MMNKYIDTLGYKAKDKVTGIFGVVTSVSYDLYGCIQVVLSYADDNEHKNSGWLDANRIKILSDEPVMEQPDFKQGYVAEGKKGPTNKPSL